MAQVTCKEVGCDRPARTRGWCVMHYSRVQRHGSPDPRPPRASKYDVICSEPGCEKPSGNGAAGLCPMHYYRLHRYGSTAEPPGRIFPSAEERFWSKVNKDGPVPEHMPHLGQCWPWTAAKSGLGYGYFNLDGRVIPAYRAAWEIIVGPIPEGLEVCHGCDYPPCVFADPDPLVSHLYLGTHAQNLKDARDKGRMPMFTAREPCGTMAAFYRHRRHGEEPCESCWEAVRAYDRARQPRRREQNRKRRDT